MTLDEDAILTGEMSYEFGPNDGPKLSGVQNGLSVFR